METEKTVEEIFVVASKLDGTDSTSLDRLKCLNALKVRLSSWLSVLHARKEGPSFMEMDLIVKDIENKLESIKKDLELHQVRALHLRKALGFPLRVGVGPRLIQASPMLRLTLDAAFVAPEPSSAAVQPVVTRPAQRPAVGRRIQPARRPGDHVVTLEPAVAPPAAHTPLAVSTQDERPQLAPPPR